MTLLITALINLDKITYLYIISKKNHIFLLKCWCCIAGYHLSSHYFDNLTFSTRWFSFWLLRSWRSKFTLNFGEWHERPPWLFLHFQKLQKMSFVCCESSSGLLRCLMRCEEGRETLRVFHRVLCNNFRLLLRFLRIRLRLKKGEFEGWGNWILHASSKQHWSLQQSSHYNTSENSQVVKIASFLNGKTHREVPICLLSV